MIVIRRRLTAAERSSLREGELFFWMNDAGICFVPVVVTCQRWLTW
ncbi:MAG: hypothetical protein AB9891_06455 [Anaerolineaceae bacterium]